MLQFRQLVEFQFRDTAEPFCLLPPCQNSWCISCRSGDYWVLKTTVMLNLKCWTYILILSPGAIHRHSNLSLQAKTASLNPSVSLRRQKSYWDLLSLHFFLPSTPISYKRPAQHTYSTEGPLWATSLECGSVFAFLPAGITPAANPDPKLCCDCRCTKSMNKHQYPLKCECSFYIWR